MPNNSTYETIYEMPPEELIVFPKSLLTRIIRPFTTCCASGDKYLKKLKSPILFTQKEAETLWQAVLSYTVHPKVEDIIVKKIERFSDGWKR